MGGSPTVFDDVEVSFWCRTGYYCCVTRPAGDSDGSLSSKRLHTPRL